ncbi:MAG: prepilin-type N-terminal cleavage/methylation domain-containing protein [Proteobacteria bacterium]|nr:prepilin-type N-terminal cleavage/methylation domain-containing protein [Pseudomonadota bacterium]MDA1309250.1 prepilin-type N-terminal cleavage/methylation domain-containing protein [Pseudomonadota bacterium]
MRQAGFTLLEVLVGLTLMGLLAVLLGGGLRTGLDVTGRLDTRSEQTAELIRGHRAFRGLIESAFPLRSTDAHGATLRFQGEAKSLQLVGPAAVDQIGGLSAQGIRLAEDGALVITGARGWQRRIAVLPKDAALSYFGAPEPNRRPRWLNQWRDQPSFPLLVRLRAQGWPTAIARPRLRQAVR